MDVRIEIKIYSAAKYEWIMREYGSYEDSNKDSSHVVAILERNVDVVATSLKEVATLIRSAEYASWGYCDEKSSIEIANVARRLRKTKIYRTYLGNPQLNK